jgi:hypothetical protein
MLTDKSTIHHNQVVALAKALTEAACYDDGSLIPADMLRCITNWVTDNFPEATIDFVNTLERRV